MYLNPADNICLGARLQMFPVFCFSFKALVSFFPSVDMYKSPLNHKLSCLL